MQDRGCWSELDGRGLRVCVLSAAGGMQHLSIEGSWPSAHCWGVFMHLLTGVGLWLWWWAGTPTMSDAHPRTGVLKCV